MSKARLENMRRHPMVLYNNNWLEGAKTKLQAQLDGENIDGWPAPCANCGANWKRTMGGRWFISHFQHEAVPTGHAPVHLPRASSPVRVAALLPAMPRVEVERG